MLKGDGISIAACLGLAPGLDMSGPSHTCVSSRLLACATGEFNLRALQMGINYLLRKRVMVMLSRTSRRG
jgi:hypothetical protein